MLYFMTYIKKSKDMMDSPESVYPSIRNSNDDLGEAKMLH